MKYTLFVTCKDHAKLLKDDFFSDYECSKRVEGDLTILTYVVSEEDDADFFELYKQSMTCTKNGIKVHGVRLSN